MQKINSLLVIVSLVAAVACTKPHHSSKFPVGAFPVDPVNMSDFNSEFDDYNSTAGFTGDIFPLCFSSKRRSQGDNFDVVYKMLEVHFSNNDGTLRVGEAPTNNLAGVFIENDNLNNALSKINTASDELGPYLIGQGIRTNGSTNWDLQYESYIFLYANNQNGDLDIKMVQNLDNEHYTDPQPVKILNSSSDDAYPTLRDTSAVYFCSNRGADFDIYKVDLDVSRDLLSNFSDMTARAIAKDTILSSVGDDKCPYIANNVMVFTSNRPGGFGGFDLYYSLLVDGTWTAPINFGPAINTAYDEYRPIIMPFPGFTNDFMIFSSNRPGGIGGFDLYYVGVEKRILY